MAQVSIVTAARREAAAEQAGAAAAAAVVVLNPGAREFLPWWRLGSAAVIVRKALSVDAPEFVMAASKGPAAADAGGNDATPPGSVRTGRRGAYRPRKMLSRSLEAVKRTVFVKYIDHTVVDCRICGDPSNGLRFGFVEFQHEEEAYAALLLDGIIIGINPLSVSPSRTAICPINPRFLPQSEAEWEICSRTIYCTNISKIVQSSNLKAFCEAYFGKVCRLKLLDNDKRSTNLAFIEFAEDMPIQDPNKELLLWDIACAGRGVAGD
ncbi:polyadenylate-binding protein-interacting protein 11-like isoform X2 [Panicum miliaceum]|uniref:Polyadenylate-binding protein-interacting protein 11-like isoform X2 n=1 Tax=Panicum miliaceum TaxID=4540 RepID=A0A3L6QST2_PANMI|nr:polyadenylate-binding protein-interacting protein 11-like isoform X2 [Panicum miliaceum]